jgi:PhnB protein
MKTHELFAYLCVNDAAAAIEFYKKVFNAREKFRLTEPSGRIGHVELDFDGTILMLSDEYPEYNIRGPKALGGSAFTIHLHVDNADEVIKHALKEGATVDTEIADHFYGERSGSIRDPFGHRWSIGHSIEEVSPEEMQRRYTEMMTTQ